MHIFKTKSAVHGFSENAHSAGKTVGFVATMGALHEGHLTLVRYALMQNDIVIVSIFVNPTQFGHDEDYSQYPRTLEEDCVLLEELGVHGVFAPTAGEMYDSTIEQMNANDGGLTRTQINPGELAILWEGELRPAHFAGVCLVVGKLLNIVRPNRAYFGEKDYQQLAIVRQLAADLDLFVEVIGVSIERADDGLARSSRNRYLNAEQRKGACSLYESIVLAQSLCAKGEVMCAEIVRDVTNYLTLRCDGMLSIGYVAIVDPMTLKPLESVIDEGRLLISVQLDGIHLIDNALICA